MCLYKNKLLSRTTTVEIKTAELSLLISWWWWGWGGVSGGATIVKITFTCIYIKNIPQEPWIAPEQEMFVKHLCPSPWTYIIG
jgi:hypothetical protein